MKRRIMENIDGEEVVKMINLDDGKGTIGFTCSCFDLLHAGHIKMLQDARNQCDYLVVGLQTDPTLDRPEKNKPIQSLEERQIMLSAVRFIDEIMVYDTEDDLYSYLKHNKPHIRILGTDYDIPDKRFTGDDLDIPIYYHKRDHDWSTTSLRKEFMKRKYKKRHKAERFLDRYNHIMEFIRTLLALTTIALQNIYKSPYQINTLFFPLFQYILIFIYEKFFEIRVAH